MITWAAALTLAASATWVLTARTRGLAFEHGYFERSSQTELRRRDRRPTHGGLVVAAVVAAGAVASGVGDPAARAVLAGALVSAVAATRLDRAKGGRALEPVSRAVAALAVPLAGARAELTGTAALDIVLTAAGIGLLIVGLADLERVEGAAALVAAVGALGLSAVAVGVDDPLAPLAGVVAGAAVAMAASTARPAVVRLGASGPIVLGTALGALAVGVDPTVASPTSAAVPLLVLAVPAAAAALPGLGPRLAHRGLPPVATLGVLAAVGALAGERVGAGAWEPALGALLAGAPLVAALLVAWLGRAPAEAAPIGRLRWAVGAVVVVGGLGAGVPATLAALDARADMLTGQQAAEAGLEAARDGELELAVASFDDADRAFASAQSSLDGPGPALATLVPGLAQNVRAARELADVGRELATVAVDVAERAGADDLRVVDGQFPVAAAEDVGARLVGARRVLAGSSERLEAIDSPWLVDEVTDALGHVDDAVRSADDSIAVATDAVRLAPQLLGADGPRRWFVAILSNAELRGAGGILGDFAIVTADDGALGLERAGPVTDLNRGLDRGAMAAALPAVYAEQFAGWQPERFWQNLTATPDFPTVGEAVLTGLPLSGLEPASGVIAIDPLGLARLLELTGPVEVASWPVPITSANAVEVLLFENYDRLAPEDLEEFQGDVVEAVVEALTTGTLPGPSELARTLAPAVAGGHLRFWSPDDDELGLFEQIGADGALDRPSGGDHVEWWTQNSSESKIDWFLHRDVAYAVDVDPATGRTTATLTVTLTNEAPAAGLAEYIIGGDPGGPTGPGEHRLSLTVRSLLDVVAVHDPGGRPVASTPGELAGLGTATVRTRLAPGGSATFVFELEGRLPAGDGYVLTLGHQPTVRPDEVDVRVGDRTEQLSLDGPTEVRFDGG